MANDERSSRSGVSDVLSIEGGDSNTLEALEIREEETVVVDYVKVEYNPEGTTDTQLDLYKGNNDDGHENTKIDQFFVSPGDRVILEEPTYEDVTESLLANLDGNQDSDVVVTIGGMKVTG